ncbi:hypothetical protein N4P33_07995 [Streptomyces sp. 15-116A]|uniref:hypothetical protein n=1 Tax=Streptomyces sp. 15-116A TaxID=2259035 RepID=UPI0021B1F043|nr:hypothetical protein [Streptomyces sp. 15-116A]MCT7352115.1 hypothetical protein [Streptomyces sp. 15-116A]
MGGGSAKPGRRKAAGPALRYEHRPGRPSAEGGKKKMTVGEKVFGCLVLPGFGVLLLPLVFFEMHWAHTVWGSVAPAWPGGAYAFAASVGALAPLVLVAFAAPLYRMNWKKSRVRSLAWAVASLPGLAGCYLVTGFIFSATFRPKRRSDWDADCYREGGTCWVHEEYPFLWAVGLATTLAVIVLLISLGMKYGGKERSDAGSSEPAAAT